MKRLVAAVTLSFSLSATPALATCYEWLGCADLEYFSRPALSQLSCQALWEVRNGIYWDNGYCFQTQRAMSFFGNGQCYITNQASVPLNGYERENVARITAVERSKGCR